MKLTKFNLISCLLLFLLISTNLPARPGLQSQAMDGAKLRIALEKLQVLGSVLYIAAHPDDENTAALAYFSNEKLLRTGYLSLTRGGGGQNLIGNEKGHALSLLRTQELLAARDVDGAEQFFTRAVDFGYSKSARESMEIWGKDEVLHDMVLVIRKFRPDVIITRFPPSGGGHGHHTASAILALEAFTAAGDASRYPNQLKYVSVWQPRRLLWNTWRPNLTGRDRGKPALVKIDLGKYNPLLGKSYGEIAATSRSNHKTQGFGALPRRGELINYFEHLKGVPVAEGGDLFDGVELGWKRVSGAGEISILLAKAYQGFDPQSPHSILPLLLKAYKQMARLQDSYWVLQKRKELLNVIQWCSGLWIEAVAGEYAYSPGASIKTQVTLINRSGLPMELERIEIPKLEAQLGLKEALPGNIPVKRDFSFSIPSDMPYSQPYWLRRHSSKGLFHVDNPLKAGVARAPYSFAAQVRVSIKGTAVTFRAPVFYRWRDPVAGERVRAVQVLPRVHVTLPDRVYYFPDQKVRDIRLTLQAGSEASDGYVRIDLPRGWSSQPDMRSYSFKKPNEAVTMDFKITPPPGNSQGYLDVTLLVKDKVEPANTLVTMDYSHLDVQTLLSRARMKVVRLNLEKNGNRIGYIMGSGDDIPGYLSQVGYNVVLLSDDDLRTADLNRYDVIITGIRAYNTREVLQEVRGRLLKYMELGGNLIVQYSVSRGLVTDQIGPYPLQLSRDRVSQEQALMDILDGNHPLFNYPNKIQPGDFKGWVQERGLYFADQWDERYQPLLACCDEGENKRMGGLLVASYGKGHFVYSGYSWFRQLPAGVAGALKFFVNMISLENKK